MKKLLLLPLAALAFAAACSETPAPTAPDAAVGQGPAYDKTSAPGQTLDRGGKGGNGFGNSGGNKN